MGLKQDIIIVNEFTVPLPGGKGSRGGTPGDYIRGYMARELATEPLAPVKRFDAGHFIQRYMARESATESLDVRDTRGLKQRMRKARGDSGVSFGYGQVSLSHEQLRRASNDVQAHFDQGHTVMKTVLSFDQEYLRKHKIIPEDFVCNKAGDYRGHVDQMKLRMAVMAGLDRMNAALYDDLRYVGVIQVDTNHVHCHLAMVDAGEGTKAVDGNQKGKINDRAKSLLRRGVDSWLDEKQHVKHLSSAVGYERRNVTTFVKRWAHQQMLRESLPQFLLATLPEDRRKWRYNTNDKTMRKPNKIVHQLVEDVLSRPGSPMAVAMAQVQEYANHRRKNEDLNRAQWKKLVDTGREQILERGVNSVYGLLRQLPEDALRVRTPMLDVMGMDYEQMASLAHERTDGAEDLVGFGFRLRSYSVRLEHHTQQRTEYHERARSWEVANEAGAAAPASRVLYDLYLEEEEYHARCAAKYRKFLAFAPEKSLWYEQWQKVSDYSERMLSLESMRKDASLRKLGDPTEAEHLGREIYGQAGGHLVALGDTVSLGKLDDRIATMRQEYVRQVSDLQVQLAAKGFQLQITEGSTEPKLGKIVQPSTARVVPGTEFDFEDVKAIDLHDMRYDFSTDVELGLRARRTFVARAAQRKETLSKAVSYLEKSGQSDAVATLPVQDIANMTKLADQLAAGGTVLPSEVAALAKAKLLERRSRTVRISDALSHQVEAEVMASVRGVQFTADGFVVDGAGTVNAAATRRAGLGE